MERHSSEVGALLTDELSNPIPLLITQLQETHPDLFDSLATLLIHEIKELIIAGELGLLALIF